LEKRKTIVMTFSHKIHKYHIGIHAVQSKTLGY
jgi:hypothetical protein